MICLRCDGKRFEITETEFFPKIKGKKLSVKSPAFVCMDCGNALMDGGQMNEMRRRIKELMSVRGYLS